MNTDEQATVDVVPPKRVYSAPRRFDLATLFVVMIVYSCLLGLFVGVGLPDKITFGILGFLTAIAVAQPTLFGGKRPRLASVIAGAVALPVIFGLLVTPRNQIVIIQLIIGAACCLPLGMSLGYISGTLVGGVFLVADWVRRGRGVVR